VAACFSSFAFDDVSQHLYKPADAGILISVEFVPELLGFRFLQIAADS
jgi:hypothetical protein